MNNSALLQTYARDHSEAAFAALVEGQVGLVYSAALRQVHDAQAAEDVTQAVFIILARNAKRLAHHPALSGWLLQTTRYVANAHIRAAVHRVRREQEAAMLSDSNESSSATWVQLEPLLDEAMASLGETDRAVLALRYFEDKSSAEIGRQLNLTEETARKRTNRALEKLRKFFGKRGVATSATAIADAVSTNAVQAAPHALAKTIAAVALAKGAAASASTLTLIKGALKIMAWTKAKTIIVAGAVVLLATGVGTVVVTKTKVELPGSQSYEAIFEHPDGSSLKQLEQAPPVLIVRPTQYPGKGSGVWTASGRGVFVGASLADLFAWAYGTDPIRAVIPDNLQKMTYDYLNTLPDPNAALREQLKKQFNLVARKEVRPMDVVILQVKDPARLDSFRSKGGQFACYGFGMGNWQTRCFTNASLSYLAEQDVQGYYKKPCVLRADRDIKYDFMLKWEEPGLTGEKRLAALRPVIESQINQLGLEIVPGRESIEALIVEQSP